jgi:DnaJ-class molecular chaperone
MKTKTIELCTFCKGEGLEHHEIIIDYHKRDYDSWTTTCDQCQGSGRLHVTTEVIREPYIPQSPRDRTNDKANV